MPAEDGGGDPLALEWVDQPGGVTDEQRAAAGRGGADHAHLEPAAEPAAFDGGGEEAECAQVLEEGVEANDRARRAGAHRTEAEPETDVGPTIQTGEQPPVAGEATPAGIIPEHDHRPLHCLLDVGALGEAPQHRAVVDQSGCVGDDAGRSVGSDDDISLDAATVGEDDLGPSPLGIRDRTNASGDGVGSGRNGGIPEP